MASITSTGVGSGLDVNSLVTQLVAAERQAADKRLATADTKTTTEFSALAKLKAALSAFQAGVATMTTRAAFEPRTVTVGDAEVFTASADATAVAGHYEVQVEQLARAEQLGSAPFAAGPDSVVGTGTLTLALGTTSFDITVGEEGKTLTQIRDAINGAADNPGVRATIIRDTAGARLVLAASTGTQNAIKVTAAGGDGGLQQLVYDPAGTKNLTQIAAAQDAIVRISGYEVRSASNTITDAIDGVTLTLKKAEPGEQFALDIARDDTAVQGKVEAFVSAFNSLATQLKSLGSYDAESKTAGPLLGDAMLRGLDAQLRRMLSDPVAGTSGRTTLASLGITTTAEGTLALDSTKLKTAIAADPAAVSRIFSAEGGVAQRLNTFLMDKLSSTGELATRNKGITARRTDLARQQEALEARMAVIEARYMKQFTALDTMLTQLQSTSNYLTQQFSNLSKLTARD